MQELARNLPAVLRHFLHHLFVQPNVHGGAIIPITVIMQLFREFAPGLEAAIHIDKLHEIDDLMSPIQSLSLALLHACENGFDVNARRRRRSGRGRLRRLVRRGWRRRPFRRWKDFSKHTAEKTHRSLLSLFTSRHA